MFSRTWWLAVVLPGVLTSCDCGRISRADDTARRSHPAWLAAPASETTETWSSAREASTLVIGRGRDAADLDPGIAGDLESTEVVEQIYDTLVRHAPASDAIVPGLASAWHVEAGGREWVFELREGVHFHDGTPVDADAVVFSLERQRDPAHPQHRRDFRYWNSVLGNVQRVAREDDHTVRITLERPYAPFLASLAMAPVAIVSRRAATGEGLSRHPVGTGPFRFVSWQDGRIVLERHDEHWAGPARLRRLIFQTISDPRQRLVALESGAIDLAHAILPEELTLVELHPRLELYRTVPSGLTYLALDTREAPLDDVMVRQAVTLAINKTPIVEILWHGMAVVADSPLAPGQWGRYVAEPARYDPERARALLVEAAAAGRFDPARVLRLYVPTTSRPHLPNPERLGRAIEANLRDIGMLVETVPLPLESFVVAVQRGDHDMALASWVSAESDPDSLLYALFDRNNAEPGQASNLSFYRDPEVHGLLTVARESDDRAERDALYARVQSLLTEQAAWVPLAHAAVAVAARRDIVGITTSATGIVRFDRVFRAAGEREAGPAGPVRPARPARAAGTGGRAP